MKRGTLINAIFSFAIISLVVVTISAFFIEKELEMGIAFFIIGIINLMFLKFFGISIKSVYPDMVFGLIDNGVLVFAALIGGMFGNVRGAIIGGAAGNTITDGIGGLVEGQMAVNMKKYEVKEERNPLTSSLGKMAGCLFGASIGLIVVAIGRAIS